MPINPPALPEFAVTLPAAPALRAWQVGQLLQAVVLGPAPDGGVRVTIQGQELTASTALALAAGQRIALEVVKADGPLLLKLHELPPSPPDVEVQTIARAWREALPRQLPLTQFFGALERLARTAPERVPPALQQLNEQLPTARQVSTADGLQRALANSGLFLEARLAQAGAPAPLAADLKAGLLRAHAELAPPPVPADDPAKPADEPPVPVAASAPRAAIAEGERALALASEPAARVAGELARPLDGALARVQLNQLTAAGHQGAGPLWTFELPVRYGERTDVLELRIERDPAKRDDETDFPWTMTLAFDFEELGPVTARVTLAAGQVGTTLWAQRPPTARLIGDHLGELQRDLEAAGVAVGRLVVLEGLAPAPSAPAPAALLDLKA